MDKYSLKIGPFPQLAGDPYLFSGAAIALLIVSAIIFHYAYSTDIPKIAGIPEIPGARPFLGHLHLHAGASGKNDGAFWAVWSKRLGSDLLQVRWGNRRVVIANSFDSVKELFVTNAAATSARPRQYIFEKYVGYDMGSHSLDEHFKAQRTAAIKSVQPRQWTSFYSSLNREGDRLIANLAEQGDYGKRSIFPLKMMQIVAMNLAWRITFDKSFDDANDPWLREYIDNACLITKVRGASNTYSDFVPILRLHPKYRRMGVQGRMASQKRSKMLDEVVQGLKLRLSNGEEPNCIAASIMKEDSHLSTWDAIKASTSMLQGSTETVPSHLCAGLGGMIQGDGPGFQEKAYADILKHFPNGDAAEHAFTEESCPYIVALYKEVLRNYAILPFSLPRAAAEEVHLKSGITIPKGTALYMNSEAANHDESTYGPTAHLFDPERWLTDSELNGLGTPHCAYGVGARVCPAWNIANRILYGLLFRMVLAFQLQADPEDPPPESYEDFGCTPDMVLNSPRPFKVRFVPRDEAKLRDEVERIRMTIKG
ncbi:cytochrome P450 [Rhizodiscina lignyota]|uniref:Cytochrome P450 n=1 Tax=Rhizodiscina lignyota TaxID=1504668 RepID=A0A9P4ICR4_9PEZI|nr:cytochrome P450 [Rhizodiscina lignyota]